MPSSSAAQLRALSLLCGFLALGAVVFSTLAYTSRRGEEVRASRRALAIESTLDDVLVSLLDAETAQRGYLLTGRDVYLAPFDAARLSLSQHLDILQRLYAEERRQTGDFSALKSVVDLKLDELRKTIDLKLADRGGEALTIVNNDAGKRHMDQARALVISLRTAQDGIIADRQAIADMTFFRLQVGIALSALLVLVLGGLSFLIYQRQLASLARAHTALQAANDGLVREATAREAVADQLRQAQKMEAVGQLTGGIAHDFNNMLAVIMGSLSLLKRRTERGETGETARYVKTALEGAERATALTNRLLAFSRQQALSPEAVNVNKFVAGLSELLRRSLGQSIQIETVLAGGLWRTHADVNQLENTILNLCINARDAMEGGGKLTIETSNAFLDEAYAAQHEEVPCGQYVLIAVTDSGAGMPPEVIKQAFDPFFTTKASGKGTGLGLSQVFGFVKQSGGHSKIYSELGQGTTVKIYLPRFQGPMPHGTASAVTTERASGNAAEIVLVVEDDDDVRRLTVESLRILGYGVRHAANAAAALRMLDAEPDVDLLFTDVVMPGMNGRKLVDEATRRYPSLKVLYTTGYTRNAIVHNGVLDQGVNLIGKPFTIDQLAAKVREVMDA